MSENALPEGWTSGSLLELADSIQYGYTASAKPDPHGPRFLRITDIQDGRVNWSDVPSCEIDAVDEARFSLKRGDIVFARTGATTGKSYLIADCPRSVFASYLIRVSAHALIDPIYLSHYFQTPGYWRHVSDNLAGNAQPNCNASKLADLSVPFPPLTEQKRIVAKVEELLARVNAARERLAKVPAILKRFRQAVLAAACSGRLTADWRDEQREIDGAKLLLARIAELRERRKTSSVRSQVSRSEDRSGTEIGEGTCRRCEAGDLPDSWVRCRIEQIATVCLGGTPSRKEASYWEGTVPWVSSGEVANCRIAATRERITNAGLQNSNAKMCAAGTVLIAMIGEGKTRGQAAILDIEAATNQNVAALVFDAGNIEPRYVWHWALGEYERHRGGGRGGNYPAINGRIVRKFPIPLPPLREQVEIAGRVDGLFTLIEALERRAAAARRAAEKLAESLLAKAFRGELVPTEAELARQEGREYEPASVLLERIQSERATPGNGASRRKPRNVFTSKDIAAADNQPPAREDADELPPVDHPADTIERTRAVAPATGKTNGRRRDQSPLVPTPAPIDQTDRNEVLAVIRQVFSDGGRRDRATAIHDVAHALGYHRTGTRIHEILSTDLLTAVRRGILENERGELRLLCRSADDYTLDHRVEMLLAAMGTGWQTRDDAITAAARHLGFRRTGPALRAAFKSAINAALRRNRIERGDAQRVRRTR